MMLIVLLLAAINLSAQQTEPAFVYKDSTNKHLSRLDYFLDSFTKVKTRDCLYTSGTFRFKILRNGKISNLQITGNLPDSLISTIKKRIQDTEGHWVFSTEKETSSASKWFVLPVFIDMKIGNCKDDASVRETFIWISRLFNKTNKVIETPNSYLLYPLYIWGMN